MAELRLENVCYRYKSGNRDVLSEVSCIFLSVTPCRLLVCDCWKNKFHLLHAQLVNIIES